MPKGSDALTSKAKRQGPSDKPEKLWPTRISSHPILTFPAKPLVAFYFEEQELSGFAGEPIAAALTANGVRVFRITEKMHRPRGFFCAVGKCSCCLMEVDGKPNVMVCIEPLRAGMTVRRQVGRGRVSGAESVNSQVSSVK
jgi:predicted molibdopterin-dependent oxidoreductase YjgC